MSSINRRAFFQRSLAATGAAAVSLPATCSLALTPTPISIAKAAAKPDYRITQGHLKQTIMGWCFKPMDMMVLAQHCKEIGLKGMEGIDRKYYPDVKALGLDISLVGSHGFAKGPCNPAFHDEVVQQLTEAIDVAADVGSKKVITFTGMRYDGMDHDDAVKRCLDTWKEVLPHAEKKGITLVLEHLNSRDNTHPMKGHPGYFGDNVDFCFDLVKQIGSPNFKLLFDIYHVSIMNGDIIRRIRKDHELIGHYHTAGNPGRCELDENQEINYPPIVQAIIDTGYDDFIAQEFIPTWDDPILALRHACMVCDV
jgi:hydroxypyruvate isomerase